MIYVKKLRKKPLHRVVFFITSIFLLTLVALCIVQRFFRKVRVWDFAHICHATPQKIITPKSIIALQKLLQKDPNKKIAILGSGYSHGGHTMLDGAWQIKMGKLNRIQYADSNKKTIIVEAGATWKQVQDFLDKDNLSVAEMQSYRNFSVGGSISVNCHGRGMEYGTIAETVEELTILTAKGSLIKASRTQHKDLFEAVIGGYGGVGIIVQAKLKIVENSPIERQVERTSIKDIPSFFKKLRSKPNLAFYNGSIYPGGKEDEVVHISFFKTTKRLTQKKRMHKIKKHYWFTMLAEQLLRRVGFVMKPIRAKLESFLLEKKAVMLRNYEMSYDTRELKPLIKYPSTSILQEYFIPLEHIYVFLTNFWSIIKKYQVNLLNISLRYVPKQKDILLNYAPQDCIAVVIYVNIWNNTKGYQNAKTWSQSIISQALASKGTYYLPYLPFATLEQFYQAYPKWQDYLKIKAIYDPNNRFCNQFTERYLKPKTKRS